MSHLANLKLSQTSPRDKLSPVARKRGKLLEQLDLQISAAAHAVKGEEFLHEVRRWVHVEGSADKQLITQKKPVRRWWWQNEVGAVMLSLRQGNRVMDIAEGKTAIEVGEMSDLPKVLDTLRQAIAAGELDEQLKKSPFVKPIKPTGSAKR
jgi:hypothetical protein